MQKYFQQIDEKKGVAKRTRFKRGGGLPPKETKAIVLLLVCQNFKGISVDDVIWQFQVNLRGLPTGRTTYVNHLKSLSEGFKIGKKEYPPFVDIIKDQIPHKYFIKTEIPRFKKIFSFLQEVRMERVFLETNYFETCFEKYWDKMLNMPVDLSKIPNHWIPIFRNIVQSSPTVFSSLFDNSYRQSKFLKSHIFATTNIKLKINPIEAQAFKFLEMLISFVGIDIINNQIPKQRLEKMKIIYKNLKMDLDIEAALKELKGLPKQ